jgi:hypothetical protein
MASALWAKKAKAVPSLWNRKQGAGVRLAEQQEAAVGAVRKREVEQALRVRCELAHRRCGRAGQPAGPSVEEEGPVDQSDGRDRHLLPLLAAVSRSPGEIVEAAAAEVLKPVSRSGCQLA